MKKLKFPLAIMVILIAIGAVFAFTAKKADVKKAYVSYHYKSPSDQLADMQDTSNWEISVEATGCGEYGNIPCIKQFDGNWNDFKEYLDGFDYAEDLTLDATVRRDSDPGK